MTAQVQPPPSRVADNNPSATRPHRLAKVWAQLALRRAQACCHGDENACYALLDQQLAVEQRLLLAGHASLVDRLVEWELRAAHHAPGPDAGSCTGCRRDQAGLPDMPLPRNVGGGR